MSRYRPLAVRRRTGVVAGALLLLLAEAALSPADQAAAVPTPSGTVKTVQPSEADIQASDRAWAAAHAKGSRAWALAEAARTGKKAVVTDETTATTYTSANPDGTLTTELTAGPERTWQDGKWRTVDATLTRAADGSIAAKAHPAGLRLGGKGGTLPKSLRAAQDGTARDLVTLGTGEEQVTLQWKGGLPEPELSGPRARYRNAVPGADVIVDATRTGFEQFVEIAERPSGAYSYTLPVEAKGLRAKANRDGSVSFADAETGAARATMPAPVMWDAAVDERSGEHTHRVQVGMKVIDKGEGAFDLVVTPDAGFLDDPKTQYPVTVDPSTSALTNTFDTYVQQGEKVDWSTDVELDFGNPGTTNTDGTPRTARSFITWNTTPIQDALIVDTNLALYNFHSGNTDCSAQKWTVWDTGASSTSSRWTAQPTWNQEYDSSTQTKGNPDCAATQPDGWINADVDTLVQSWASAKATRGHMGLRAATDDVKAWKRVNSANATANQPKLSVTYNYRPSDGTNRQAGAPFKSYAGVWAVNTTTPTLRDTFTDPDGDTVNGTFQVYDAATNTPITTPAGEGLLVSDFVASGKPASVTVPAGQLKDGKTYKFRTNAYDGTHYNLSWSGWTQFVVDTTAPGEPKSVTSATYPENWGGGGAGVAGTFDVTTGDASPYEVQYRVDPFEDDAANYGWSSVRTTTPSARAVAPEASYTATPAADGNHVTQTRTVDRAGNVGPIKDYGFTAGNRNYNRAQKVDIKLPQPDLSASAPAQEEEPHTIRTRYVQPTTRTSANGQSHVKMTLLEQASPLATKLAAQQRRTRAGSMPDPVVDQPWCSPAANGAAQKSLMTRTEACLFWRLDITWKALEIPGAPDITYETDFEFQFQTKVDKKGDTIKTWTQVVPLKNTFPGGDRSVLFGSGDPDAMLDSMCYSSACDNGAGSQDIDFYGSLDWDGGMTGDIPNDTHVATGTTTHKWNGDVTNASGTKDKDLSINMPTYLVYDFESDIDPPSFGNQKRDWQDSPPARANWQIDVRCDKVSSNGAPGCVLSEYVPEYKIHAARYPAAAAHIWLIQNKSKPSKGLGASWDSPLNYHPGPYSNGDPRSASGWDKEKSRQVMCAKTQSKRTDGWVPKKLFLNHPKTAMHPEVQGGPYPDEISCDEFPFAATYQSPGLPANMDGQMPAGKNGGGECIQTVAAKADDGSDHLLDDTRYDAPTWDETCGRSSMSKYVNSGAMSGFGNSFAPGFRLLDRDAYWVNPGNTPGMDWFNSCDTAKPEVLCTMSKP
ncbi:DNRLRE domain-containing protein [Streptomyces sp. NPDC016845]|uniref:DNRLRE domain-containing protein n=1 Tax=Streptomyces sp. NPDC016845 TaxID=3364972 RepID=UPI003795B0DF